MNKSNAEEIAISALGHIASIKSLLERFLSTTGITPDTLRTAAEDPGFLAASLDFLRQDETEAIAFATNHGLRPDDMERAAHLLANDEKGQF